MLIALSLIDVLIDLDLSWERTPFCVTEFKQKKNWTTWVLTMEPDRVLKYAVERQEAKDLVNTIIHHVVEPQLLIWTTGEYRTGLGRIAYDWLFDHNLHGDLLVVSDTVGDMCRIWRPDLFITRSALLALHSIEYGNTLACYLDGFQLKEIVEEPQQFYSDAIFPVDNIYNLKKLIGNINHATGRL